MTVSVVMPSWVVKSQGWGARSAITLLRAVLKSTGCSFG
jgi:hypothetical protein